MIDLPGKLEAFQAEHGRVVAEWVVSRAELFLVAPTTRPPLTGDKVCAWTTGPERGYVYAVAGEEPAAYGELNDTPGKPGELWIGHFLVAPWARGRNIGRRFLGELLAEGFARRQAAAVGLVVFPDNQAAIRCYRSVGLTDVGPQRKRFPGWRGRHEMRYMKITRECYSTITSPSPVESSHARPPKDAVPAGRRGPAAEGRQAGGTPPPCVGERVSVGVGVRNAPRSCEPGRSR